MADEPRTKKHRFYTRLQHAKLTKSMKTKKLILDEGIQLIDALLPPEEEE